MSEASVIHFTSMMTRYWPRCYAHVHLMDSVYRVQAFWQADVQATKWRRTVRPQLVALVPGSPGNGRRKTFGPPTHSTVAALGFGCVDLTLNPRQPPSSQLVMLRRVIASGHPDKRRL